MSDDPQLLRRYAIEGDQDAFAELVRRHLPVVYNAALRRVNGNTHLAEEATQIVFIQLARKARSLLHHPALLGWLHTSTRYAATLLLRREQRLTERHELFGAMNLEPDPALPWERARPLIDAALDSLSAFDRQAVLLRFFSNRSYAEVAENLHISEEAARKRVDRAIDALPRQFRRRGVATSASALAAALAAAPEYAAPPALAGTITSAATLAAGTGSASIASAFLSSMSTLKLSGATFVLCSLLGLVTFGGATAHWWHEQQAREAQLAATSDSVARVQARLHQIALKARTAPAAPAAAAATAHAPLPDRSADARREQYDAARLLQRSPRYAPIREQTYRLQAQREFGAFLAARQFPRAKEDRLRSALVDYYQSYQDAWTNIAFDAADGGQQLRQDLKAAEDQFLEQLRPTFSDDEIKDIKRCLDAQRMMGNARNISVDLGDGGFPLTRTQELGLAMILADQSTMTQEGGPAGKRARLAVDPRTGLSAEDRAVLDDARAFLSPEQVARFEAIRRDDNAARALRDRAEASVETQTPKT